MRRSSLTPAPRRPAPALAGWIAALALMLAAASPASLAAMSDLFILDTEVHNSGVNSSFAGPPLVAQLGNGRFVTVQRIPQSFFVFRLELRSWQISPTGDITPLDVHIDLGLGNQDVAAVTELGTTGFATALKPSPTSVHLVTWNVSSTGMISKAHDHPQTFGADGEVDLVTLLGFFTYRVYGVLRDPGVGPTVVRRWDVDQQNGQVFQSVPVEVLEDSTARAIAAFNGTDVAVTLRRSAGEQRLFHFTHDLTTGMLDLQSSATGPPVSDVDVAYTATGRIVTAVHLPGGQLRVAAWNEITFPPPWSGKILYSPASATTRDPVAAISIAPLMNTKVATAVINGAGNDELIAWDSNSLGSGVLDRLEGTPASTLSFTHVGWDEIVSTTKSNVFVFRATAWTDLIPQ